MSKKSPLHVALAAIVTGLTLLQTAPAATASRRDAATSAAGPAQHRYLVRYAPGTDVSARAHALREKGMKVGHTFTHAVRGLALTATAAQAAALRNSARVEAVTVDGIVHAVATQSPAPWGLDRIDQATLPLSDSYTAPAAGSGVGVYVVDTGVLSSHTDFGGRVNAGYTAIADANGTTDCNGHGTHVAGTIAGATYGVAKAATIIPVRVLDCTGSGYMSDVVAGLDWVAAQHTAGTPAVANLSIGGAADSTVDTALTNVIADGVTAAVAAGNDAADACGSSPARVPAALTVAASDSTDRQATFSNYGTCVDLYAPGVSIVSDYDTSSTATATMSGTSMASPHAAGAAAVVLAQNPALSPAQVTTTLTDAATTSVVTGVSTGTPNRLLRVPTLTSTAPAPAATAPAPATNVTASPLKRSASVAWTRGADGGSALTGQRVTVYAGTAKVKTVSVAASASKVTVGGLTGGKAYAFTVTETNAVGSSPESARSNTVTVRR